MILGIDFGMVKIGFAVADKKADALPLALSVIQYKQHRELREKLSKVISDYNIDMFVVGILPAEKAGDAKKKESFNAFITLLDEFSLPIVYVDEQRSTKAAKSFGNNNPDLKIKNDDALAACVILETYLGTYGST